MLSVIRVTCSSVDSSLSPTGLTSCALNGHRHCQARAREGKRTINKAVMKNITKEFPLIRQHMRAQKGTGVLLNTHSHRVHLQRIELQLLRTPTHAHAFAAALCTPEAETHTLVHRVHLSARAALANQSQLTVRCVYIPSKMAAEIRGHKKKTRHICKE